MSAGSFPPRSAKNARNALEMLLNVVVLTGDALFSLVDALAAGQTYAPASPILQHVSTDSQTNSVSRPMSRTSRCGKVTRNNRKYDGLCSPACFQSRKAQSEGASGAGTCEVIKPRMMSGLVWL